LDLAKASKVGVATIRRVETLDGEIPVTSANESAIRRALEAAGVEFIDENGGGVGVRKNPHPLQRDGQVEPLSIDGRTLITQDGSRILFGFLFASFPQSDADPAAVLVDELDAGAVEHTFYNCK
jgi:hypothetical protein